MCLVASKSINYFCLSRAYIDSKNDDTIWHEWDNLRHDKSLSIPACNTLCNSVHGTHEYLLHQTVASITHFNWRCSTKNDKLTQFQTSHNFFVRFLMILVLFFSNWRWPLGHLVYCVVHWNRPTLFFTIEYSMFNIRILQKIFGQIRVKADKMDIHCQASNCLSYTEYMFIRSGKHDNIGIWHMWWTHPTSHFPPWRHSPVLRRYFSMIYSST